MMSDNMKIGVLLVSLGFLFLFLGIVLFFDAGLLAIGNILFLSGFPFIIGFQRALSFFNPMKPRARVRGIVCFFLGFLLVLFRWAFVGILVELFGMVEMFGTFLPIVLSSLRSLPYVGTFFSLPVVGTVFNWLAGAAGARTAKRPPV